MSLSDDKAHLPCHLLCLVRLGPGNELAHLYQEQKTLPMPRIQLFKMVPGSSRLETKPGNCQASQPQIKESCQGGRLSDLKWHREISLGQQPWRQSVRGEIRLQKERGVWERVEEKEGPPKGAVGRDTGMTCGAWKPRVPRRQSSHLLWGGWAGTAKPADWQLNQQTKPTGWLLCKGEERGRHSTLALESSQVPSPGPLGTQGSSSWF